MPPETDRARLAEALAGQRGTLTRFARGRSQDLSEADADDLVSDVVLRLVERADLLAQVENLTAYLLRAVANGLTDLVRRRRETAPLPVERADPAPGPEETAQQTQLRRRLDAALSRLSEAERAVWLAVEVEGHTFRDLAALWGEPIGTLLSRKNRAAKSLRKWLADDARERGLTPR